MRRWLFVFVAWLATASALWPAEKMPPKPDRYFNDYAGVVSAQTASSLNSQLEDFEKQTSNQVLVAVFPKMESDSSIEDYSHRIAESWKVGQPGKNNGAVLFVFVQDHKIRIDVGYGLEGALPDALANRIEEDEIRPHFRNNDYGGGLTAGVTAILQAVKGEYKGNGSTLNEDNGSGMPSVDPWTIFVIIFILISVIRAMRIAKNGGTVYGRSGRSIYPGGIFWGGGFGGGGFGGGGGSSFGGGGGFTGGGGHFGGGGASGSW